MEAKSMNSFEDLKIKIFSDAWNFGTESKSELLWASSRELLNVIQADQIGCHIITVAKDIIKKLQLIDYNLEDYSLDTVKTFYKDAADANFKIN